MVVHGRGRLESVERLVDGRLDLQPPPAQLVISGILVIVIPPRPDAPSTTGRTSPGPSPYMRASSGSTCVRTLAARRYLAPLPCPQIPVLVQHPLPQQLCDLLLSIIPRDHLGSHTMLIAPVRVRTMQEQEAHDICVTVGGSEVEGRRAGGAYGGYRIGVRGGGIGGSVVG